MKIVHISTFLQGGAGRVITDLAIRQKKMGHDVHCITNKTSFEGYSSYTHYESELKMLEIPLVFIDGIFQRKDEEIVEASKELRDLYEHEQPDIVHSHAAIPSLAFLMARKRLNADFPVLQTMHGWGNAKKRNHEKQDISIFTELDSVVAVSQASKDKIIQKGGSSDNLSVIVNGIVHKNKSTNRNLKEITGECRDKFLIGCIGTLCERKNQLMLLKALGNIREDFRRDILCCLIGDSDPHYKKEIDTFISQFGLEESVLLAGYTENAAELLSEFDLMVLPSHSEGLPITIIECFREKVLVLASDIPENLELVQNGITGFTFQLEKEESLSSLIEEVMSLDRVSVEKILNNAATRYLSSFTVQKMVDQYERLYRNLVCNRSKISM